MPRILIVDDEADIIELIRRYALREGYEVTAVSNGKEAVEACVNNDFDIIIMDVMMPDIDGFSACKIIRSRKDIPVLMLSARGTEYDKLFGFEAGVDDYVTKPFSPRELMARVNVIINRHRNTRPTEKKTISVCGIEIDDLGHNVTVDGKPVVLTAKEYAILLYLVQNEGIVLTREQILDTVWGYAYDGTDRIVDWQIKLLRSKLGDRRACIRTVRGTGYKFEKTFK